MPSAASVKIEKQVSTSENALADAAAGNSTPLRQVITLVEHKIRNLEKRKSKLESYRELQASGKELNADQKVAVAKYNEVTQTLEFARDLYKQFLSVAVVSEKEAKKQAKKEAAAKNQAELARLREILLVQDALNQMGNENVREDFLQGRNGAAQLNETELKLLDDLYPSVTPKHEAGNPTAFTNDVQAAAEHLLAVVDGKPKEVSGGTYSQVKEILGKIHESGYFDQAEPAFEAFEEPAPVEEPAAGAEAVADDAPHLLAMEMAENHAPPPADQPPEMVQEIYYPQVVAPPPPMVQPPRPISEMLGTGSFFFLQESEIEQDQQQISSQTFTNQSFVGGPQQQQVYHQNMANNVQVVPQQVVVAVGNNNNGLGESLSLKEELHKPQAQQGNARGDGRGAPRPNNSYYQNNNEYNNRPRQNRNNAGSRPHNNRNN